MMWVAIIFLVLIVGIPIAIYIKRQREYICVPHSNGIRINLPLDGTRIDCRDIESFMNSVDWNQRDPKDYAFMEKYPNLTFLQKQELLYVTFRDYVISLSNIPIINSSLHHKPATAAFLFLLAGISISSCPDKDVISADLRIIIGKILTTDELAVFNKCCFLFASVIIGDTPLRAELKTEKEESDNLFERLVDCYGDVLFDPELIDEYADKPIRKCNTEEAIVFSAKFYTRLSLDIRGFIKALEFFMQDYEKLKHELPQNY